MVQLKQYILEAIDDNNIFYKLDVWFNNNEEQISNFINIIEQFKNNQTVSKNEVEKLIKGTFLEEHLKEFINFIIDDMHDEIKEKDYIYQLQKIIEFLISNKSIQNKWHKKKE